MNRAAVESGDVARIVWYFSSNGWCEVNLIICCWLAPVVYLFRNCLYLNLH